MAESIPLKCMILYDTLPARFVIVNAVLDDTVHQLKAAIRADMGLNHIPSDDIVIQKFSELASGGDTANSSGNSCAEQLESLKKLSDYLTGSAALSGIPLFVRILSPDLSGNKRGFDHMQNSAPKPLKRRKLTLLPHSATIYQTDADPVTDILPPAWAVNRLPSLGAGFTDLTSYPNLIAADKTRYIELLDVESKYQYLFLRPRRFGKSTFLQMLSRYYDKRFEKNFPNTFGCLYIGQHPTIYASSLLVLCFDFSKIEVSQSGDETKQNLHHYIHVVLEEFLEMNHQFLPNFEQGKLLDKTSSLRSLNNILNLVKRSGRQLFVGVDEYDAPANMALFSYSSEVYRSVTNIFKSFFFASIKDGISQDIVTKYWLTGVLPAFREGVSPLAGVEIISNDARFHGLCGFMDTEVETIVKSFLQSQETDTVMHELRQQHNGHRFIQAEASEPLASLYNPQHVFAHLRSLAGGRPVRPRDEIEALHTSHVLNEIGESAFPELFLLAASSKLPSEVMFHFPPREVNGSNPRVTQSLLFFFGVLTYAESDAFLGIPNRTMQQLISVRFRKSLDQTAFPINAADTVLALRTGDVQPVIRFIEAYLGRETVRTIRCSDENSLQTMLAALWYETDKNRCITELCLLADPKAKSGNGRYNFADMLILSSDPTVECIPCLELKNASLDAIWRGRRNDDGKTEDLEDLRREIRMMNEDELLCLKVRYRQQGNPWTWHETTINSIKNAGIKQVTRYVELIRCGDGKGLHAGIGDSRVRCGQGQSKLFGYVVIVIGGTRVLAWKVIDADSAYMFTAIEPKANQVIVK